MEDQILLCMFRVVHWAWSVTLKGRLLAEGTVLRWLEQNDFPASSDNISLKVDNNSFKFGRSRLF
jgi:hypothetical protein